MTEQETFHVVLFLSVSHALKAERLLKKTEIPTKLIPVPKHISSDCGVCIRFSSVEESRVRECLTGNTEFSEIRPLYNG